MRSAALPRLTLAAALITVLTGAPALAADPYASASASITSLRYRLVDMDPTDGVAPSATFVGGPAMLQTMLPDSTVGWTYYSTTVDAWPSQGGSIGDTLNGAAVTSDSFTASSTIDGDNPPLTQTSTWGNIKNYYQGTTFRSDATTSPNGDGTSLMIHLGANTGIIFEGTATIDVMINPDSLTAFKQQTLADAGPDAVAFYAGGSWSASAGVNIDLYGMTPQAGANGIITHQSNYSRGHYVTASNYTGSDLSFDDVTLQEDSTHDFVLDFWNLGSAGTSVLFQFKSYTEVSTYAHTQYEILNANPNPNPIPEPGTWALMGLGLAGVALARRRHAA